MAPRIKIKDLPKDEKVSEKEVKKIKEDLSITPVTPDDSISEEELRKISGGLTKPQKPLTIDCW